MFFGFVRSVFLYYFDSLKHREQQRRLVLADGMIEGKNILIA